MSSHGLTAGGHDGGEARMTSSGNTLSLVLLALFAVRECYGFGIALPSLPQPDGLSRQQIKTMAQRRYGKGEDDEAPLGGRVVVITGAAGGIGRELSSVVCGLGGTVIAMDRDEIGLKNLEEALQSVSGSQRFFCLPTKHEDLASVSASADEITIQFDQVDLLVNNAGLTYRDDCEPGCANMKSKHGKDLAFTVNFLSHVLLVEKLMPSLQASESGRIVHLTSSYHWKVDGSEIIPCSDGSGPLAYQSDPNKMSDRHLGRSYANTKLAQLWHSRSIQGCTSVCACPTWASTGIAGDENRAFLERFAFPVSGPGITSALNAMLRTDDELGDALSNGRSFVANSRIIESIVPKDGVTLDLITQLGWRDSIVDLQGLILLLGQRFTHEEIIIQETSPESQNSEGQRALYEWSLKEIEPFL